MGHWKMSQQALKDTIVAFKQLYTFYTPFLPFKEL